MSTTVLQKPAIGEENRDNQGLDEVAIDVKSHRLLRQLMKENPELEKIMQYSKTEIEALLGVRTWVLEELATNPKALAFYKEEHL